MERTILHCDCNGFYASVECVLHPEYKKVPMAVCGNPENRHGIILAKNELAKKYKIQTAETVWKAKQKCPDLVLAPPHHDIYHEFSKRINQIYQRYTDQVEPFGIDESWLDVSGSRTLFGTGAEIADRLRHEVKQETGLTISVGVSFNKIFAKLGSDYKKPDATTVISRLNFEEIVFPLPVTDLLYVGKSAAQTLSKLYVHTIGDLARCDRRLLTEKLGKLGGELHDYACGLDKSPVRSIYEPREVKSVGNGLTFKRNLLGREDIWLGILALSDSVAARLRADGMKCTTVQITIRNPSFHTITRQKSLPIATYLAREIAEQAMQILEVVWNMSAPIRMLTVTASGLLPAELASQGQISLFETDLYSNQQRQEQLEQAMDAIRGKFGQDALTIGGILQNDIGLHDIRRKEEAEPNGVE